jgi:hypothetical protein
MRYLVAALLGALAMTLLWGGYERWQHTHWRDYAHTLERASQAATEATKALRTQERAHYEEQAREADANYVAGLDRARVLTRHYLDSRRVQPQPSIKPVVPQFAKTCPPIASWLSASLTCKPVPTQPPMLSH